MSTQQTPNLPAPFVAGDTWFEQMSSYVLSRVVDAEVAKEYRVDDQAPLFFGADGRLWRQGQPVGTVQRMPGAMSQQTVLLGGLAVVVVLFLVLRK